jgi:hypothetical protein
MTLRTFLGLPPALTPYATDPRWVLWRLEKRRGKLTKPPYQPCYPGRHASSTKPETSRSVVGLSAPMTP